MFRLLPSLVIHLILLQLARESVVSPSMSDLTRHVGDLTGGRLRMLHSVLNDHVVACTRAGDGIFNDQFGEPCAASAEERRMQSVQLCLFRVERRCLYRRSLPAALFPACHRKSPMWSMVHTDTTTDLLFQVDRWAQWQLVL